MMSSSCITSPAPYCLPNSRTAEKVQMGVWNHSPCPPPPQTTKKTARYWHPVTISLFRNWRKHLSRTRFSLNDLKTVAENWLNGQGQNFYQAGLNKLVICSNKCLNTFGGYVEKWSAIIPLNFSLLLINNSLLLLSSFLIHPCLFHLLIDINILKIVCRTDHICYRYYSFKQQLLFCLKNMFKRFCCHFVHPVC